MKMTMSLFPCRDALNPGTPTTRPGSPALGHSAVNSGHRGSSLAVGGGDEDLGISRPLFPGFSRVCRPWIALFLLVWGVILSGCGGHHTAVSIPVSMPETFSSGGEQLLPGKWWESLQDERLNRLMEQGINDNLSLRISWDRLAQADAIARKAGARLLPEVNLTGGAERVRRKSDNRTDYSSQYSLGLDVSYELDLWGQIRSTREAALLDIKASEETVFATAIVLSAAIAQTWFQLAEARSQVDVIDSQVETNRKVLALITLRFRQGQSSATDVLRQRQLVMTSQGQRILARERVEVLQHQLAVLLGRAPGALDEKMEVKLIELPKLPTVPLPAELVQRRPDVRSAFLKVQAADQRIAAAMADRFPRISLSAGADTSGIRVRDLFDNWLANIAGNLIQPLFDGNQRRAETDRAKAVLSETLHEYGQTILNALKEVEDALVQESRQGEYLQSLRDQMEAARIVVKRTRESYVKGQFDYLRVLDALVSLQSLERNYLTAKRQMLERRIDLCRAIAGSWEMERPKGLTLN